jgi:hypothetical protein
VPALEAAAPNLELLVRVEDEMSRVAATLRELESDDADAAALVAWVPALGEPHDEPSVTA